MSRRPVPPSPRPSQPQGLPRDAGLTLLELTATMAVFALVAVMGLQALAASVRVQDVLSARHDQTWDLAAGLALIRHDLGAMAPLPFAPPQGPEAPALVLDPDGLTLSLAGLTPLPGTTETGQMRVTWRHDAASGTLYRQAWLSLAPANARAQGPEVAILSGIDGMRARVLTPEGWQDRFGDPEVLTAVPRAVEITLQSARLGDLRVMVTP